MTKNLESLELTCEQSGVIDQRLDALLTKTYATFTSMLDVNQQLKLLARSAYYQGLLDGAAAEQMARNQTGDQMTESKKAGIFLDAWKLPIFERHLASNGYSYENRGHPGPPNTVLLTVTTSNPAALMEVIKAAQLEAAMTGNVSSTRRPS